MIYTPDRYLNNYSGNKKAKWQNTLKKSKQTHKLMEQIMLKDPNINKPH